MKIFPRGLPGFLIQLEHFPSEKVIVTHADQVSAGFVEIVFGGGVFKCCERPFLEFDRSDLERCFVISRLPENDCIALISIIEIVHELRDERSITHCRTFFLHGSLPVRYLCLLHLRFVPKAVEQGDLQAQANISIKVIPDLVAESDLFGLIGAPGFLHRQQISS